jgi:hypothetical protein
MISKICRNLENLENITIKIFYVDLSFSLFSNKKKCFTSSKSIVLIVSVCPPYCIYFQRKERRLWEKGPAKVAGKDPPLTLNTFL